MNDLIKKALTSAATDLADALEATTDAGTAYQRTARARDLLSKALERMDADAKLADLDDLLAGVMKATETHRVEVKKKKAEKKGGAS